MKRRRWKDDGVDNGDGDGGGGGGDDGGEGGEWQLAVDATAADLGFLQYHCRYVPVSTCTLL